MSQRDADAITRLLHAYADAVLASDEAWWGSLWTEDATWDLGPDRVIEGRDAIVEHWRGVDRQLPPGRPAVPQQHGDHRR